jgi:hypothetical protein
VKAFILILTFSFSVFNLYTCSEDEKIVNPPSDGTKIDTISLSYSSARQGEKIVAKWKDLNNYNLAYIELNNEDVVFNKTSDSTISLFIPYIATDGQFVFHIFSQIGDTVLFSPRISITDLCTSGICLDWNTRDKIVESDSWIRTFTVDTLKWTFESSSDTLFFKRDGICHDECHFWHTIAFKRMLNNQLPEFLFAVCKKREFLVPDVNDTLRNGVIRIDQWDSASVYSGTFSFEKYNWIFWANVN